MLFVNSVKRHISCLVVRTRAWLWGQGLFGCKILFFTPSSEHELTYFDRTDFNYLQTCFHSIDFSAGRRLVWNTNCLHFQHFKKLNYLTPTRRKLKIFLSWMLELSNSSFWLLRSCLVVGPRKHCQWLVAEWQVGLIHALKVLWTDPVFDHKQLKISFWQNGNGAKTFELQKEKTMWIRVFPMIGIELQIF